MEYNSFFNILIIHVLFQCNTTVHKTTQGVHLQGAKCYHCFPAWTQFVVGYDPLLNSDGQK